MTRSSSAEPGSEAERGDPEARDDVVGLVPAAGWGRRVAPIPCSKELFPVGFTEGGRVRVACDQLLEGMRAAGVHRAYFVIRDGKWDIPAFLGSGEDRGMSFAYLVTDPTPGVPSSLDWAYPFVRDRRVVCGFPDILLEPFDLFGPLLDRMEETGADIVLALFPDGDPTTEDLVELDPDGRVTLLQVKPGARRLPYSWAAAAWGPAFTELMHRYVRDHRDTEGDEAADRHLGHALQAAVEADLCVQSVAFPRGSYLDIGRLDNLRTIMERRS